MLVAKSSCAPAAFTTMRHFSTPMTCASRYPSRAAKKYCGGTRAIDDRTVFNGRKCSNTPSTTSAVIHRKTMIVHARAVRRVRFVSIMKGKSQREGYLKTRRASRRLDEGVSPVEQALGCEALFAEDFVDLAG